MTGVELKGLKGLKDLLVEENKQPKLTNEVLRLMPIQELIPGKYQPRSEFNDDTLSELANSIKSQGIIQPIVIRKVNSNHYEIVAGERRWKAAQRAGLTEVPVIIREISDHTALAFALIENLQREDLNPIDQALALSRLKEEFSITHEEIAETVGYSRPTVSNLLRLLSLNEEIKNFIREDKLQIGHAKVLLVLNEMQQIIIARRIVEKGLSVRESEKLAQKIKQEKSYLIDDVDFDFNYKMKKWNEVLTQKLLSQVKVKINKEGEGSIVIKVNSIEELEWFVENVPVKKIDK